MTDAELRRIYEAAERFATHDPGVDWPSARHTDAVDAICAALDRVREDLADAREDLEDDGDAF